MFYNLHQHREATCRRQKEAWEETILMRLKKEKQNEKGTPSNQDKKIKIPIVIWGLEASPSYFDKHGVKKIGADNLHENYLYRETCKDGRNWGVRLIKTWINQFNERPPYCYDDLINALSDANFDPNPNNCRKNTNRPIANRAIHLVYDIFPEWHGLPVTGKLRDACFNKHYMCEKIPDFKKHLEHINHIFSNQNFLEKGREIYFVWLGTKQANKQYSGKKACATFFCCLKKEFETISLYYNPKGFVTKSKLEVWKYDCSADFQAIGVPADWSEHLVQAGYHTVEALRNNKPAALHQKLNGFRKKNKLDIPALGLDQVKSWF